MSQFTRKFKQSGACYLNADERQFDWMRNNTRLHLAITLLNEMKPDIKYNIMYQEDIRETPLEKIYTLYAFLGEKVESEDQSSEV